MQRESSGIAPGKNQAAAEITVGPLLARAKLMRQRGQWDESIAICTDALRRCPDSVTAYSLLGEIYESMGKLEDASQWYAMAVERDPGNYQEKQKLERTLMAQQAQRPVVLKANQDTPSSPAREKTLDRTLQWFDRVFPPGKTDTIARLIFAVSGVLAAILLLSAAIIFFVFRQSGSQNTASIGGSDLLPTVVGPLEPIIILPDSSNTDKQVTSGAFLSSPVVSASPSAKLALAPASNSSGSASKSVTPAEAGSKGTRAANANSPGTNAQKGEAQDPDMALRNAIAQATGVGVTEVPQIRHDVRFHAVNISLVLPTDSTEPDIRKRRRVLVAAIQAAQAIGRFDGSMNYANFTISLAAPSTNAKVVASENVAFMGYCNLNDVRNLETNILTVDELYDKFGSAGWGKALGGSDIPY
ncbi:MAG: tetratricopeptide repeat protein [bacterium]|jgi:hypothetical protein